MSDNTQFVRLAHASHSKSEWEAMEAQLKKKGEKLWLYNGEIGFENDTNRYKVGKGRDVSWSEIPYYEQTQIGEDKIATESMVEESIEAAEGKIQASINATKDEIQADIAETEGKIQVAKDEINESLKSYAKTKYIEETYATISELDATKNTLNDYATKKWVEDQTYAKSSDVSSTYATKSELNAQAEEIGECATKNELKAYKESVESTYTTTVEADKIYAKKGDLTGKATESWVEDKGYVTNTNLQDLKLVNEDDVKTIINDTVSEDLVADLTNKAVYGYGGLSIYDPDSGKEVSVSCRINPSWNYVLVCNESFLPKFVLYRSGDDFYYFNGNGFSSSDGTYSINSYTDNKGIKQYYITVASTVANRLYCFPLANFEYCLREDTLIPMEDGTYKKIKDVKPKDKVGFYNTFSGKDYLEYNVVTVLPTSTTPKTYKTFTFSNGSVLHIGGNHMLYNLEKATILGSEEWEIGMHGMGYNGESIELLKIEEKENSEGYKFYNIYTRHYRYLANNVLCGHSIAVVGKEFSKLENKPYIGTNKEYQNYVKRHWLERLIYQDNFTPVAISSQIVPIHRAIKNQDNIESENLAYLNSTDYKVTKYQSGLLSQEEYEQSEILREAAREKIRQARSEKEKLQEQIKQIKREYLDTISSIKGVW